MWTDAVDGWYWISSRTSLRNTTEPGVVAMFSPSRKGRESTGDGIPPLCSRSLAKWAAPVSRLPPQVAVALRRAAGLPARLLVGASASTN